MCFFICWMDPPQMFNWIFLWPVMQHSDKFGGNRLSNRQTNKQTNDREGEEQRRQTLWCHMSSVIASEVFLVLFAKAAEPLLLEFQSLFVQYMKTRKDPPSLLNWWVAASASTGWCRSRAPSGRCRQVMCWQVMCWQVMCRQVMCRQVLDRLSLHVSAQRSSYFRFHDNMSTCLKACVCVFNWWLAGVRSFKFKRALTEERLWWFSKSSYLDPLVGNGHSESVIEAKSSFLHPSAESRHPWHVLQTSHTSSFQHLTLRAELSFPISEPISHQYHSHTGPQKKAVNIPLALASLPNYTNEYSSISGNN